jgi:hypothetical protein
MAEVELGFVALHHAVNGIHRLSTGDLSGGMSAHAISHHPEAKLVIAQERVFIDLALLPDVRRTARVKF